MHTVSTRLLPWLPRGYDPCSEKYSTMYYNLPEVQKALHANVTGIPYAWTSCSDPLYEYWKDSPRSMLPIYRELIAAGIRIWVFSGDADSVVPLTATRYSIDALHLPTLTNWYPWYDNEEVSQSNYYGNTSSFVTSIVFHNYNYHVLMVQILFRSLDGVKSIRV